MTYNVMALLDDMFERSAGNDSPACWPTSPPADDLPSPYWSKRAAALLATIADDDQRVALRDLYDEREAIAFVDGRLSPHDAGRLAYDELAETVKKSNLADDQALDCHPSIGYDKQHGTKKTQNDE